MFWRKSSDKERLRIDMDTSVKFFFPSAVFGVTLKVADILPYEGYLGSKQRIALCLVCLVKKKTRDVYETQAILSERPATTWDGKE